MEWSTRLTFFYWMGESCSLSIRRLQVLYEWDWSSSLLTYRPIWPNLVKKILPFGSFSIPFWNPWLLCSGRDYIVRIRFERRHGYRTRRRCRWCCCYWSLAEPCWLAFLLHQFLLSIWNSFLVGICSWYAYLSSPLPLIPVLVCLSPYRTPDHLLHRKAAI